MQRLRARLNRPHQEKALTTGLLFLATELVQEIWRYLHWPTDFYNLSLVSRTLHRLATPKLYSILVVGYHRPDRISALLTLLEVRPEMACLVTTLVFDEDVKCIGPKLPILSSRVRRREIADGWDPRNPDLLSLKNYPHNRLHETISRQLNVVLSGLPNIRRVIMRNLHPLYTNPGVSENKPAVAANRTPLPNSETSSNGTLWTCLSGPSSSITELFVNGITNQMPQKTMVSRLTSICISDLYYGVNSHALQACAWNVVLMDACNLRTLAMICVKYAHTVLVGRSFPHLETLELCNVLMGEPDEDTDALCLSQFLRHHSSTLHTLALSIDGTWTANHCCWLSDEDILPKLRTLRLDHIPAYRGSEPAEDRLAEKTNIITSFIEHRPTILDIGIYLTDQDVDRFAESLARTRPMRNIFIGSRVIESLIRPTSSSEQHWRDITEGWWEVYELFEGLTISRSGFRPILSWWKFWRKTMI